MLKWTLDAAQLNLALGGAPPPNAPQVPDADPPPDLFTAMQQQLGLQMKSGKAPVEVMIIDKVEKPSANEYTHADDYRLLVRIGPNSRTVLLRGRLAPTCDGV